VVARLHKKMQIFRKGYAILAVPSLQLAEDDTVNTLIAPILNHYFLDTIYAVISVVIYD